MGILQDFFRGIGQFCKCLFLTPSWGSKHRQAQKEYEERLDEAKERYDAEVEARLRQWMANEGPSSAEDIYKKWNGEVSLWQIKRAMKKLASQG